jgi:hypothetical protein
MALASPAGSRWACTTIAVVVLATHARCATVSPVELPIEFVGEVVVTPGKGEPPFPTQAAAAGGLGSGGGGAAAGVVVCVLDRQRSFTLGRPGYAQGASGKDGRWVMGAISADGSSVHCPVPVATTSGNTTVGLAFSGAHRTAVGPSDPFPPADPRWALASLRHFATFMPAFSRRPYIFEDTGAVVVEVDHTLAGERLVVNVSLAGVQLASGVVVGPRDGVRVRCVINHASITLHRICMHFATPSTSPRLHQSHEQLKNKLPDELGNH